MAQSNPRGARCGLAFPRSIVTPASLMLAPLIASSSGEAAKIVNL
jgi:hypothetical protein